MRLVSIMQFWLDVEEADGATPETAWQRCLEDGDGGPNLQQLADETAGRLTQMPGVVRSQVILATVEPITGNLRATFDQQRMEETRLLDGVMGPQTVVGRSRRTVPARPV